MLRGYQGCSFLGDAQKDWYPPADLEQHYYWNSASGVPHDQSHTMNIQLGRCYNRDRDEQVQIGKTKCNRVGYINNRGAADGISCYKMLVICKSCTPFNDSYEYLEENLYIACMHPFPTYM